MTNYQPSPIMLASFAERFARQQTKMGLAFAAVTAICLGLVIYNAHQDLLERQERRERFQRGR